MLIYKAYYTCIDAIKGVSHVAKYFKNETQAKKWLTPMEEAAKILGIGVSSKIEEITVED